MINDEESGLKAGITGSDILWDSGMGKNAGDEIPIYTLNPRAARSNVYLGATTGFINDVREQKNREPELADLVGTRVATKYTRIAEDFFFENSVEGVRIFYVPGRDEAMQYVYPDCFAILGIRSSDTTRIANGLEVLTDIMDVTVRMIQANGKLSRREADILDAFKERVAVAVQKNTISTTALL